jgi:translation initiation factor 2 alpha subunit (eIF-2alpha)
MNAPIKRNPQPKYRLVKPTDKSPAAARRLEKAMNRISKKIEKSGMRDELLNEFAHVSCYSK